MGLGPGEIVLILVIAYVIVGPEDMTKLARTLAKVLRQARRLGTEMKEELDLSSVTDLTGELSGEKMLRDKTVKETLHRAGDRVGADLNSVMEEIQKAEKLLGDPSS